MDRSMIAGFREIGTNFPDPVRFGDGQKRQSLPGPDRLNRAQWGREPSLLVFFSDPMGLGDSVRSLFGGISPLPWEELPKSDVLTAIGSYSKNGEYYYEITVKYSLTLRDV